MPARELQPFLRRDDTAEAALVLLARAPQDAGPVLLAFVRSEESRRGTPRWLAAGNLLARSATAGFAAAVLERLEITLHVAIEDPDHPAGERFWGRCGTSCGGPHIPEGFPPIATYVYSTTQHANAFCVAAGRHGVWAQRRLVRSARGWPCRQGGVDDEHAVRVGWLSALLGCEAPVLEHRPQRAVVLAAPEGCRERVLALREESAAAWRGVVDRLRARGRLSREEGARLRPRLSVIVRDLRQDRRIVLPAITGVQLEQADRWHAYRWQRAQ